MWFYCTLSLQPKSLFKHLATSFRPSNNVRNVCKIRKTSSWHVCALEKCVFRSVTAKKYFDAHRMGMMMSMMMGLGVLGLG